MTQRNQHSFYCKPETWEGARVVAELLDRPVTWVIEKAAQELIARYLNPDGTPKKGE